ncbi:hypothetical protein [Kineococcus sp. SYSU DK003]|uniref:hypothetical protein n=1 Tax=Kineococcus sp. SYSU DK003 TaxID=3383124 RepID=UPI003D7E0D3F
MPRTPDDGSGPLDVDAAFAEIVAHWGEEAPGHGLEDRTGDRAPQRSGDTGDGDGAGADVGDEAAPRHLADPADHRSPSGDGAAPPDEGSDRPRGEEPGQGAEDRSRLVRPAGPLPPAPHEDVPDPQWFATPRPRDEEPPELRALSEEEGFVPADPSPLPRDVVGWAAWIAVVGAPLFLLVVALGWNDVPRLLTAVTAGVFVAGFATLVIRLPGSRDDDDDDGAVV